MARTKQTARKTSGGKPLANGKNEEPEDEPTSQGEEWTGRW